MKRILLIGHHDIRQFLRDKIGFIWLFLMPIGFIYITGAVNSGGGGKPSNPRPSVLIENHDEGFLGEILMSEMDAQGLRLLSPEDADEARRGVRIPTDFTEKVLEKEQVDLEFFKREGAGEQPAAMVEIRLVKVLIRINSALVLAATELHGGMS
ncbi:MAG TPA: hypothetical protein EYG38_17965 [Verrucomicrobia bacterium]|nr:hypothetical protein [Verrucomicrobiota bacterium]